MARGQTVVQRYANNTVGDCPETTKNNYQFGSVQKCQDKCQPSVNKITSVRLVSYRTYRFPGLLGTSIYAMSYRTYRFAGLLGTSIYAMRM